MISTRRLSRDVRVPRGGLSLSLSLSRSLSSLWMSARAARSLGTIEGVCRSRARPRPKTLSSFGRVTPNPVHPPSRAVRFTHTSAQKRWSQRISSRASLRSCLVSARKTSPAAQTVSVHSLTSERRALVLLSRSDLGAQCPDLDDPRRVLAKDRTSLSHRRTDSDRLGARIVMKKIHTCFARPRGVSASRARDHLESIRDIFDQKHI